MPPLAASAVGDGGASGAPTCSVGTPSTSVVPPSRAPSSAHDRKPGRPKAGSIRRLTVPMRPMP